MVSFTDLKRESILERGTDSLFIAYYAIENGNQNINRMIEVL